MDENREVKPGWTDSMTPTSWGVLAICIALMLFVGISQVFADTVVATPIQTEEAQVAPAGKELSKWERMKAYLADKKADITSDSAEAEEAPVVNPIENLIEAPKATFGPGVKAEDTSAVKATSIPAPIPEPVVLIEVKPAAQVTGTDSATAEAIALYQLKHEVLLKKLS